MNNPNAHLPELPAPHSWMKKAACTGIFTELFFYSGREGVSNYEVQAGLEICQTCPVIKQCLKFAFDTNDQFAVLGGTTPSQRRLMLGRESA